MMVSGRWISGTERSDSMIRRRQARHSFTYFLTNLRQSWHRQLFSTFPSTLVDIDNHTPLTISFGPNQLIRFDYFLTTKRFVFCQIVPRHISDSASPTFQHRRFHHTFLPSWIATLCFHDFFNILRRIDSPLST